MMIIIIIIIIIMKNSINITHFYPDFSVFWVSEVSGWMVVIHCYFSIYYLVIKPTNTGVFRLRLPKGAQ